MPGRFSGMPAQAKQTDALVPPQVGTKEDEMPDTTDDNLSAPDTPYSGGPDKEAALTGADPMQTGTDRTGTPAQVTEESEDSDEAALRETYEEMSKDELLDEARSREGLTGYSQLNKAELIDLLVQDDASE